MNFRANTLEHSQPTIRGYLVLVQLDQSLIKLAGSFTDVGLGEVGQPLADALLGTLGEAQAAERLLRYAQVHFLRRAIHNSGIQYMRFRPGRGSCGGLLIRGT